MLIGKCEQLRGLLWLHHIFLLLGINQSYRSKRMTKWENESQAFTRHDSQAPIRNRDVDKLAFTWPFEEDRKHTEGAQPLPRALLASGLPPGGSQEPPFGNVRMRMDDKRDDNANLVFLPRCLTRIEHKYSKKEREEETSSTLKPEVARF
ncbi:hypothetical protein HN011_008933 [Eciton burchellii]|nr:hypothetical protein HN011_008933 [Eciton burchellii]